jgi:hypothetical protein
VYFESHWTFRVSRKLGLPLSAFFLETATIYDLEPIESRPYNFYGGISECSTACSFIWLNISTYVALPQSGELFGSFIDITSKWLSPVMVLSLNSSVHIIPIHSPKSFMALMKYKSVTLFSLDEICHYFLQINKNLRRTHWAVPRINN